MESRDRQQQVAQTVAWLWVVMVHAGLFWWLTHQERRTFPEQGDERLRLVFVAASPPIAAEKTTPNPRPARVKLGKAPVAQAAVVAAPLPVEQTGQPVDPVASAGGLLEQGRQWARQQAEPDFDATPFRSRRARLPGGERAGVFRMGEPPSPARVVGLIAQAFGDRDPCPDIKSRISGLLAASSDSERELLHEELRRDREYCQP